MVSNDQDKLPGRLQQHYVSKSRDAGPVNFIVWFGSDILNVPVVAPWLDTNYV
jgi:hypothetical protein